MEKESLVYWKYNAEEDYINTPISVLRYISELENEVDKRLPFILTAAISSILLTAVIYLIIKT